MQLLEKSKGGKGNFPGFAEVNEMNNDRYGHRCKSCKKYWVQKTHLKNDILCCPRTIWIKRSACTGISQYLSMIAISRFSIFFIFSAAVMITGCSDKPADHPWTAAIPSESPFVFLHQDADFFSVLDKNSSSLLQETSNFDITTVSEMQNHLEESIPVKAVALFPGESSQMHPLFILQDPGPGLEAIAGAFRKDMAENNYHFRNQKIHILHLNGQRLFATQLRDWIVLSNNSIAVENSYLTYLEEDDQVSVPQEQLANGDLLLNTPKFENWVKAIGAPRYLPKFHDLFSGTDATVITVKDQDYDDPLYERTFSGTIPLTGDAPSKFLSSFISEPGTFDLDRYIPTDAAFFTIFHQNTASPSFDDIESVGPLDTLLRNDTGLIEEIANTLSEATAFVSFEASGFLSTGEHMYLRRLDNNSGFSRLIRELERDGYLQQTGDIYYASSAILGRLLGGPNSGLTDFYISRSANAAVLTKRSGLSRRIDQDRRRRAVYYYDDDYMAVRERHPEQVSMWMYARTTPLLNYLDPMLSPVHHAGVLAGLIDVGATSLVRDENSLELRMDTYFSEDRTDPVRDLWVYDIGGGRLTGKPVLGNLGRGSRDQIIVATDRNEIIGIASDGTGFLEMQTDNQEPVGSPMLYDWYGNNQLAVLIAAGNQIFAWNSQGVPLPNFPVTMDEQITAPLVVSDVARDGRPEMIVATADRKIHVLNQRGRNIEGWPQEVNTQVQHKPVFKEFLGEYNLWVTAGNGLFSFTQRGERREAYPVFIESDFGPVTFHENHILAGASDGHLYAIGEQPYFADSLVAAPENNGTDGDQRNGIHVRRVYVGNSPIINAPVIRRLRIDDNSGSNEETIIGVQTRGGNLFLLNEGGQLRMTRNMGQESADYDNMMITDLDGSGKEDIIGISSNGRIYAWQIESGERLENMPAASMRQPIIADILGNGDMELITQTRDGVRAWSFRFMEDEQEDREDDENQ